MQFYKVGVYIENAGLCEFTLPRRYKPIKGIGIGSQGIVLSAFDFITNRNVAIKKLRNIFPESVHPYNDDKPARQTYREFACLSTMKHPMLLQLLDAFTPQKSAEEFCELYLVTDLQDLTLDQVIRSQQPSSNLPHSAISFFIYQILAGLNHIHQHGIIHRDLKPMNIGVKMNSEIKIMDFGLARLLPTPDSLPATETVVTRRYRAPEVELGLPYDEKIDVWALGCIFGELIKKKALFESESTPDHWKVITSVLGPPDQDFLNKLPEETKNFLLQRQSYQCEKMNDLFNRLFPDHCFGIGAPEFPGLNPQNARDLLSKMLTYDPAKRIGVREAANHPYIQLWYRDEHWNQPNGESRYDSNIENSMKTIRQWKEVIFNELKWYETQKLLREKTEASNNKISSFEVETVKVEDSNVIYDCSKPKRFKKISEKKKTTDDDEKR